MEDYTKINAIYPEGPEYKRVSVFGYSSKSLPGIEIIGLGNKGRGIKEKFVYLIKENNLKIPRRRYILCVDDNLQNQINKDNYKFLELPLLLLFSALAGLVPIRRLEDCYSSGIVNIGAIIGIPYSRKLARFLVKISDGSDIKLISDWDNEWISSCVTVFPLKTILARSFSDSI